MGLALRFSHGVLARRSVAVAAGLLAIGAVVSTPARAQNATWAGPGADWNSGANWSPTSVPTGTAIFPSTATTSLTFSQLTTSIGTLQFNAGAPAYVFSIVEQCPVLCSVQTLNVSGTGIVNNSANAPTFSLGTGGDLIFQNASTAANANIQMLDGLLSFQNTSNAGTAIVTMTDPHFPGTIQFRQSSSAANATFTVLGSTGAGGGELQFLDTSTAGNATIVNNPGLASGGSTEFGTLGGTDTSNAGTAHITNNSSSITSFYAHTSAANATIVNNFGAVAFQDQSMAGHATITNNNGGFSFFLDQSTADHATIRNGHFGDVEFGLTFGSDTATAGNASITNRGLLNFNAFTNAGSAVITNRYGGETDFNDFSNAGSATIVNRYNTATYFNDDSDARNANITNRFNGATFFYDYSSARNATITTMNGGATFFYDNSTGENAQFITNGSGFVDFSGSIGPNGDGHVTAGSIAGSGTYYIGGFNTLTVGGNNLSTEVSGVIADYYCGCSPGPGTLEKVGTGTLILSGINAYSGDTLVNGGTLLVTGSIASSDGVFVDHGATLGGTGTVAATFLSNGAILAPGLPTALGTLTVNDALFFCNCTFYDVKVTSTGNDLTQVVAGSGPGFANLEGTVRVTSLNNSYKFNSPYTILTAQGGFAFYGPPPTRFDSLMTPTGINGSLSYTLTDVNLTLLSALGQLPGLNINQHNVANVLDTLFNATGSSGALGAIFNGNVPQNLSQVSGETATGTQQATFEAMNLFLGLLTDPSIDGRGGSGPPAGGTTPFAEESDGASAYAAKRQNAARDAFAKFPTKANAARNDLLDPRWSVWGSAFGGGGSADGNAAVGSNSSTARAFGLAAGADYRISPATLAGFALAGGGTNFSVNGFGSGRSDLFQAGAFVRHTVGAAYVSGALAYGWQDVTTDRTVTVAGLDRLHAEFNANAWSGRIEGGYRYVTPWMGVTPYAAGQFTTYSLPAYAEQALVGTNAFALNYAAKDVMASRTELGVRTDRSFAMRDAILTLRGRLAWAHDFNTDRNISAVFQTLPGAAFVVNGAAQAHDSALTTASAEMKWLNGWSAAAVFEGEFSGISRSYAGKGVVRYSW